MKYNLESLGKIKYKGIYKLTNLVNNKVYIGSTTISFAHRWKVHLNRLRRNEHNNTYLQNSWNKHSEDNFEFSIVEIIYRKDFILKREEFYIEFFKSYISENGYNLERKPDKSEVSEETKNKISKTLKEGYKSGRILKKGPEKGKSSWNKGLVCKFISEARRKASPTIKVYNKDYKLLAIFRSAADIEEWSLNNIFPEIIENNYCKVKSFLQREGIYRATITKKIYKGLYFERCQPLLLETEVVKWMNSGEDCDVNPEPSPKYT
jgi:group I intron endonuclease